MLHKHFDKQAIILIDEYDTPMNDSYVKTFNTGQHNTSNSYLTEVLSLFRNMFEAALKNNSSLYKSIVTGILRVAKSNLFSGLNNFTEDSILDDNYSKYFGFTEEEVRALLHKTNLDHDQNTVDQMQSWYNGYNIGGITIYNPWSIMNWLSFNGQFKAYWVKTGSTELIETALMLDSTQNEIQSLIEGNSVNMVADTKMVFSDITTSPNALYNLLLFSGYLTATTIEEAKGGAYRCYARIPNKEVLEVFETSIIQWINNKFNIEINQYNAFIEELLEGDIESFTANLKNYLEISTSFYSTGPKNTEMFYNGFMLGLIASISNKYFVETEKESGAGRADLILIPKANAQARNAIIMEFKSVRNEGDLHNAASEALTQIKNKNYISKISAHDNIKNIIIIGLAFRGKDVEIVSMVGDERLELPTASV